MWAASALSCSAGSLTGAGDAGGQTGAGGAGGNHICSAGPTTCTPGVPLPIPSGSFPAGNCSMEGASCEGFACHDWSGGYNWKAVCCGGEWRLPQNLEWTCPPRLRAGDPFICWGDVGTSCAAGRSYCSVTNVGPSGPANEWLHSCQPLCAAGDCSCFCDRPEGCSFNPPGLDCPGAMCTCGAALDNAGQPLPGAVTVQCEVPPDGTCGADPAADVNCAPTGLPVAQYCAGPRGQPPLPGCMPLADSTDSGVTDTCAFENHYWCCPN